MSPYPSRAGEGMPEEKKQYDIEYLRAGDEQIFASGALMTVTEKQTLESILNRYSDLGAICDVSVSETSPVPQSFDQALDEIIKDLENEVSSELAVQECQSCSRRWLEEQLNEVEDLSMRVAPGEPMPSGECPACGAVCHPKAVAVPSSH